MKPRKRSHRVSSASIVVANITRRGVPPAQHRNVSSAEPTRNGGAFISSRIVGRARLVTAVAGTPALGARGLFIKSIKLRLYAKKMMMMMMAKSALAVMTRAARLRARRLLGSRVVGRRGGRRVSTAHLQRISVKFGLREIEIRRCAVLSP